MPGVEHSMTGCDSLDVGTQCQVLISRMKVGPDSRLTIPEIDP